MINKANDILEKAAQKFRREEREELRMRIDQELFQSIKSMMFVQEQLEKLYEKEN